MVLFVAGVIQKPFTINNKSNIYPGQNDIQGSDISSNENINTAITGVDDQLNSTSCKFRRTKGRLKKSSYFLDKNNDQRSILS